MSSISTAGNLPAWLPRRDRSINSSLSGTATESFGSPVAVAGSVTTPGRTDDRPGGHLTTRRNDRTVAARHQILRACVQLISVGQIAGHIAPSERAVTPTTKN